MLDKEKERRKEEWRNGGNYAHVILKP